MTIRKEPRRPLSPQRRRFALSSRSLRFFLIVIAFGLGVSPHAQAPQRPATVFRSGPELVLVNVVVRDKSGAVVRGLSRDDFAITEDDKPQTVTSFDFEELDKADAAGPAAGTSSAEAAQIILPPKPAARAADVTPVAAPAKVDMRGRRLIVLFFDLSSMQPEEVQRAVKSAHDYVDQKLAPADLIAVVSFSTSFNVDQDFTSDRAQLATAIDAYGRRRRPGFDAGTTGDAGRYARQRQCVHRRRYRFNIFNTDRRLDALQTLADQLSGSNRRSRSSISAAA